MSAEQVAYVAEEAHPVVVFLETADHQARWVKALAETASITTVVLSRATCPATTTAS